MSKEELKKLKDLLRKEEGNKDHIYADKNGVLHFGIGHRIIEKDPEHGKPEDTPVSEERIEEAFKKDVNQALKDVGTWLDQCEDGPKDCNKLPKEVKQILASMLFQIGLTKMNKFIKLRYVHVTMSILKDFKNAPPVQILIYVEKKIFIM